MFKWKKSHISLPLNQKLETIKLSEEACQKPKVLGLLHQTRIKSWNAKEKSLKEIKSAAPMNTHVKKKTALLLTQRKF